MSTDHTHRTIRPFQPPDAAAVVAVWHRAGMAAYTFLPTWQAFTLEHARGVFDRIIRPHCALWVATLAERVVAYLAMQGSSIDRLYVDPLEWRQGWGTQRVHVAKHVSPRGLELHTHQENVAARALYERHGCRAVTFGFRPPPESAPDVEYHWRPASPPKPAVEPTPHSVRSCVAPALGRGSLPAFIKLRVAPPDACRGAWDRVYSWAIRLCCTLPDNPGVDSAHLPAHGERSDWFAGRCAGHPDVRPTFHRRGKEGCLG